MLLHKEAKPVMSTVPYFFTLLATYKKLWRLALHEATHIAKYMINKEGGGGV